MLDALERRHQDAERRVVVTAWATASLQRAKRVPGLKRLLRPFAEPPHPVTPQEAAVRQAEHDEAVARYQQALESARKGGGRK